jgi:hypothetical protein
LENFGGGDNDNVDINRTSPNIIRVITSRRMRWAGHVTRVGEKRNPYKILIGKRDGKRPLKRRRHRWEDNIRIDLK